jgi:hypothetical protein
MTGDVCWLGLLIIASLVWLAWVWRRRLHPLSHTAVITPRIQRLLRPRTPHDCPACRQQAAAPTHAPPMANGRCRMHGGKSLHGIASPRFKHGRYSKYLFARLAGRYLEEHPEDA